MRRKGQSKAFLRALRKKHGLGEFRRRKKRTKRKAVKTRRRRKSGRRLSAMKL